jgi:hypothetical protein
MRLALILATWPQREFDQRAGGHVAAVRPLGAVTFLGGRGPIADCPSPQKTSTAPIVRCCPDDHINRPRATAHKMPPARWVVSNFRDTVGPADGGGLRFWHGKHCR